MAARFPGGTGSKASLLFALACMAAVSACTPAVSPSPSQRATASPASPTSSVPASASIPMLIDTDVAPDDLVAIAFLLAAPNVAITVSGTGEAHCAGGVFKVVATIVGGEVVYCSDAAICGGE